MEAGLPIQVMLPLVIAAMTLGVGMSLRVSDFTALLDTPRSATIGLLAMFGIFPGLAFLIAWAYALAPELAVGLVLLAASPSASTSTLFTYLARGDVALSVALTTVSKLVPVLTIPAYVVLGFKVFGASDKGLSLSFTDTSDSVLQVVLLPTLIGMLLLHYAPAVTEKLRLIVMRTSVIALVLLIVAIIVRERSSLSGMLVAAGPAALTLCLLGMACTYAVCRLSNVRDTQRTAITIEVGMQSGGTAIAIAAGVLAAPVMAIPAVVYSLLMYVVAGIFAYWRRGVTSDSLS